MAKAKKVDVVKTFSEISEQMTQGSEDVAKCQTGNRAAGTRVRKMAQDIKNLCTQLRKEVLALR